MVVPISEGPLSEVPLYSLCLRFSPSLRDVVQISVNGVVSFGEQFPFYSPELFPGTTASVYFGYLVAPYWVDGDLRRGGNITWEILSSGGSEEADEYLSLVSQFIEGQMNTSFVGSWMMMVNYNRVPSFLSVSLQQNNFAVCVCSSISNSYLRHHHFPCPFNTCVSYMFSLKKCMCCKANKLTLFLINVSNVPGISN